MPINVIISKINITNSRLVSFNHHHHHPNFFHSSHPAHRRPSVIFILHTISIIISTYHPPHCHRRALIANFFFFFLYYLPAQKLSYTSIGSTHGARFSLAQPPTILNCKLSRSTYHIIVTDPTSCLAFLLPHRHTPSHQTVSPCPWKESFHRPPPPT